MAPVDLFEVVAGQDRGARFGFLGASAVLGRSPTAEVMLTDPAVGARHALVRVEGPHLRLIDLNSGPIALNDRRLTAPTPLHVGDLVQLGDTTLRVLWEPGVPAVAAAPPPPSPPAVALPPPAPPVTAVTAPPITLRATVTPGLDRAGLAAAGAAIGTLLATVATFLALTERGDHLWQLVPGRLGAIGALLVVALIAATSLWGATELDPRRRARAPLAATLCAAVAGGVAGFALALRFLPAAPDPADGATALLVAAVAVIACAGWRVALTRGPRRGPWRERPPQGALLCAAAAAGGLLSAIAAPLTWTTIDGMSYGGFDSAVAAGRPLVPLGLTVAACCLLVPVAGLRVERRTVPTLATLALAASTLLAAFAIAVAVAGPGETMGVGLTLVLAGAVLAPLPCAAGALWLIAPEVVERPGRGGRRLR